MNRFCFNSPLGPGYPWRYTVSKMNQSNNNPLGPGDFVLIIDGYFVNYKGSELSVSPDRIHAVVEVDIFGRPNPVELELLQLRRTDSIDPIEGGPQDYDRA